MKLKTKAAILSGKMTRSLLKALKRNGSYYTGVVSMKIDPQFLSNVDKAKHIIGVTGTNGKTTTSNMIGDTLRNIGMKVIQNSEGSNTKEGIASVFSNGIDAKTMKVNHDVTLLELDELWLRKVIPNMEINSLTITNLFQDSYERNANMYFIYNRINQAISSTTKLILNASDASSQYLGSDSNPKVFFNVDILEGEQEDTESKIQEIIYCKDCGTQLEWEFKRYHHVGKYHCPKCGFTNPQANYIARSINRDKDELVIQDHDTLVTLPLILDNVEAVYNQTAAYATMRENGFSSKEIVKGMQGLEVVKTRYNVQQIGSKEVITYIAKGYNSVATTRCFFRVGNDRANKTVIYLVDNYDDPYLPHRNPGWLYTVDMKYLDNNLNQLLLYTQWDGIIQMVCALDGVNMEKVKVCKDISDVLSKIDKQSQETIYVITDINVPNRKVYHQFMKQLGEYLK